ncbi:MAG: signal transduction histidine kinase [Bacteroidia bacterium]|jgi:signal transduction histidine kinase
MKIAIEIQKAQQDDLAVELDFKSDFTGTLHSITAVNALRIVQEALQNAVKHSKASSIKIKAVIGVDELTISITDNGEGMVKKGNGFGLPFMEQRAEKMNAKLSIKSSDNGTEVLLTK